MAQICEGWNVVELATGSQAVSVAGMILADNGARVVKIEPPGGDHLRTLIPSGFLVWNRGKESVELDLQDADQLRQAKDLIANADALIVGLEVGQAERLGLGYDDMAALNPALVYCAVTGFGSTGPYASLKPYDHVIMAKAGVMSRGAFAFRPGPIFANVPFASAGAAHQTVSAVLAALIAREQTGRGQYVETALVQGLVSLDYFGTAVFQYMTKQADGVAPEGFALEASALMAASRYAINGVTSDGRFVATCPQLPHQAQALSRALGLSWTIDDPRFAKQAQFATAEDAQEWEDLMWEAFRTKTWAEWRPIFEAEPDLPFELMARSEESLDHPQIVHDHGAIVVEDPAEGPIRQVGPIATFGKSPSVIERPAPALGENKGPLLPRSVVDTGAPDPAHPLAGVTIVEFGYFYAMPFGVTMAGALGARVIKIEDGNGDPMRFAFGPPDTGAAKTMEGKESLSIDLSTEAGRKIAQEAAARADVVVNGFRPGVAERMGFDYATLSALNEKLVYVHACGYGPDGPYAKRPMYATPASAMAGGFYRQCAYWMDPEFSKDFSVMEIQAVVVPRLRPITDGDANAALGVLTTILLGLAHVRRTGQGQFIASSMLTSGMYAYSDDACTYPGKAPILQADPDQMGLFALYRFYQASSGWVFLAAPSDEEWNSLLEVTGRADLATDTRFATAEARHLNDDALVAELSAVIATRTATEWERDLTAAGVGCAEVEEAGHSGFTSTDPVMLETGWTYDVDHPSLGRIRRHGPPAKFSATPARIAVGCVRGQHTDAILAELGYSPSEIDQLKQDKAAFGPS